MKVRRKTKKALAMLLPAGVLGISSALASTPSEPVSPERTDSSQSISVVADRLREIRAGVSELNAAGQKSQNPDDVLVAEWINGGFGWRNGGWGNGGWHNGGWGNGGWHNGGWGNGWHNAPNWGNGGWHNWHNFWHNW